MQVMRKTIVDGSATSGFQRTGLLALGGQVPGLDPIVRVQTICVEEDAAKIVARTPQMDTYDLSRLGIPLIELATEPDITSPEQAQEVAAQIGMILRSTMRVKRGLGTIRQDVNISIAGGARVELKGCQDLRLMPQIIRNEVARQAGLSALAKDIAARRQVPRPGGEPVDVTGVFDKSEVGFVRAALRRQERVIGVRVLHAAGMLGRELCPNYRVGSELADVARSCGFGGLMHTDEPMQKYGVDDAAVREALHLAEEDAGLLLIGPADKAAAALSLVLARVTLLSQGVQKEVRKVNPDATSSFLRPMPGASRMYPETDVPLVPLEALGKDVPAPKLFTQAVQEIVERAGISQDQARELVKEGIPFDDYLTRFPKAGATFIAAALLTYGKEIKARYNKDVDHVALLEPLLSAVQRGDIVKEAVFEILCDIAQGKTNPVKIDFASYGKLTDSELRSLVDETIAAERAKANGPLRHNALMGLVMTKARGKADGKRIMELIKERAA
jgi:glutamyl-tRNA(Gln) amidotransferase subunit E